MMPQRTVGTILLAIFFGAGALICLIAVLALAFPGSFLEAIWSLKPEVRDQFYQIGSGASIALMAAVGAASGLASIGLAEKTEWGRRLAIVILSINLTGDSLTAFLRHDARTLIGLPIGGFMIWYLARRAANAERSTPNVEQRTWHSR